MSELVLVLRKSQLDSGASVVVPPSKSASHRWLIAAALAQKATRLRGVLACDDTSATVECLRAMGARARWNDHEMLSVCAGRPSGKNATQLDCGESGSTARFLLPIASVQKGVFHITGRGSLINRPVKPLLDALRSRGAKFKCGKSGHLPVVVHGATLRPGVFTLPGDVSSQFVSGLLFALPLLKGDSEIRLTSELQSRDYVEMTLHVLGAYGVVVRRDDRFRRFWIPGRQVYHAPKGCIEIEADYSSAAYIGAVGALVGPAIRLQGLRPESFQSDRRFFEILCRMGGDVSVDVGGSIDIRKRNLRAVTVDVSQTPDLVPVLAVIATQAKGTTRIVNAGRVRMKESDRLSVIARELRAMGANIRNTQSSVVITGPCKLHGSAINPAGDHRIAMAMTCAALIAEGESELHQPECVNKSFPDFFHALRKTGATVLSRTRGIGEAYRVQLYGGSHEKVVGVRVEGLPIGTCFSMARVRRDLELRRPSGLLTTQRREADRFVGVEGVRSRQGLMRVTGEKVCFEIENKDTRSAPYEALRFTPRPNHGDYTTFMKYGGAFDYRGGGFLSARMTAGTVVAGSIARQILARRGIHIAAYVRSIGTASMAATPAFETAARKTYRSDVRCPDVVASRRMAALVRAARKRGDSLGGIVECQVLGLPVGVGEPVFGALDAVLAHYLFCIPAVKGVEFGNGFAAARMKGSENNDPYHVVRGNVVAMTNRSGGVQGGLSNGMPLVFRVAVKPTSSISQTQQTVNLRSFNNTDLRVTGRHDPCVAIRAPIIVETTAAMALLDLLLRGNSMDMGVFVGKS